MPRSPISGGKASQTSPRPPSQELNRYRTGGARCPFEAAGAFDDYARPATRSSVPNSEGTLPMRHLRLPFPLEYPSGLRLPDDPRPRTARAGSGAPRQRSRPRTKWSRRSGENKVRAMMDLALTAFSPMPIDEIRAFHDYTFEVQRKNPDVIFGHWLSFDPTYRQRRDQGIRALAWRRRRASSALVSSGRRRTAIRRVIRSGIRSTRRRSTPIFRY